jgi:hypothetical protein
VLQLELLLIAWLVEIVLSNLEILGLQPGIAQLALLVSECLSLEAVAVVQVVTQVAVAVAVLSKRQVTQSLELWELLSVAVAVLAQMQVEERQAPILDSLQMEKRPRVQLD